MKRYTPFSLFMKQALAYFPGGALIFQPEPGLDMIWDAVAIYADYLEIDGVTVSETYQGIWHIPTIGELTSAIDYSKYDPAADVTKVPGIQSDYYWSSTTRADDASYAWLVYFSNGVVDSDAKTSSNYVRCVRQ
jgi:hypothetical protein